MPGNNRLWCQPRPHRHVTVLIKYSQFRPGKTLFRHLSCHDQLQSLHCTKKYVVHSVEVYVRVGDMVALHCPNIRMGNTETSPTWTSFTPHKRDLSKDMNSTSPFLIHQRNLVLLNASKDHQGNYSCSTGNHTFWSKLVVYPTISDDYQKKVQYTRTCYAQDRCALLCPSSNIPRLNIPNVTRLGITWEKDGRSQLKDTLFFSSVEETDQGTFNCTRSFLYKGQMYNMTFTIALIVKPQEPLPNVEIISPQDGVVFEVDLGSDFVVNCTATLFSVFDEIYWTIDKSTVVQMDSNLRVFSNHTIITRATETRMTALLIFREVLKEDLSKDFNCKLESVSVASSLVTVSLEQKKNSLFLIVIIAATILLTAVTALTCVRFKVEIFLCLREQPYFCPKSLDSKPFDASLMCYKSESEKALNEEDIKWLEHVLEKELGYKLCCNHNNLSGEENPVMDGIEQSHAVILVPVVSNLGPDRHLITSNCSTMDNSSTRVILIRTEMEKESKSIPELQLHEAAPLLGHVRERIVTWRGTTSKKQPSSFIKHLRYHLTLPQHKEQPISAV